MSMSLATAQSIVAEALAAGQQHGFKPLTVVVLDAGGHIVAVARQDGASNNRFEIAHGKAYGALALGMGSRALMERAEQQAYFITAAAAALGGRLIPVPGGVLVRADDGTVQGAVGISGDSSDNDETAASKAIQAAGLTAQIA
ncbi:GlcG/HbpS family heme-binding protein [Sinomonas albida]|uniref:GlcG/HbpS family heme-binding protein n=1 Tax=Sinomonas albida TaxID=369942 RepID=UPI0010A8AB7C|nr:heme-binding protein [Sinomonas albida]